MDSEFEIIRGNLETKINRLVQEAELRHKIKIIIEFKPLEDNPIKVVFVINVANSIL